jgi:hypothetical protein
MQVMQEQFGFFPTVQDELTRAIGIIPFLDSEPLKSARYLNEISAHQQKKQQENAAATAPDVVVRSVAKKCVRFARQAHQDGVILKAFHTLASEEYVNPRISLKEEAAGAPAVSRLVRFIDLRTFAKTGNAGPEGFTPLGTKFGVVGTLTNGTYFDQYTHQSPSVEVAARIDEISADITNKDLRTLVPSAVMDQEARFNFWHNRLQEFTANGAARVVVEAALQGFES